MPTAGAVTERRDELSALTPEAVNALVGRDVTSSSATARSPSRRKAS